MCRCIQSSARRTWRGCKFFCRKSCKCACKLCGCTIGYTVEYFILKVVSVLVFLGICVYVIFTEEGADNVTNGLNYTVKGVKKGIVFTMENGQYIMNAYHEQRDGWNPPPPPPTHIPTMSPTWNTTTPTSSPTYMNTSIPTHSPSYTYTHAPTYPPHPHHHEKQPHLRGST
jgi:hypothetical protein